MKEPKITEKPYEIIGNYDTGREAWWIVCIHDSPHKEPYCSECKNNMLRDEYRVRVETNYCPRCGARMIGKRIEDYK